MFESHDKPLVSVVTPVYNGAKYLEQLIQSVLTQDYPNVEHIVIDDGSTDDGSTVKVLASYPSVRWWSRENRGQYATINEGFRTAQGSIVTTISADDFYASTTAISTAVRELQSNPDVQGVYGVTLRADHKSDFLQTQPIKRLPQWCLLYYLYMSHCSLFLRRDAILRDEMWFDETLKFVGDADWIMRMIAAKYRFRYINHPIAAYRYHLDQLSNSPNLNDSIEEHKWLQQKYKGNPWMLWAVRRFVSLYGKVHYIRKSYYPQGS